MQRGTTGRSAEVSRSACDFWKKRWRNATLLGNERHEPRIRLVRCKRPDAGARDAAAFFEGRNDFVHAADGRAGKSVTIELQLEAAVEVVADGNGVGIFSGATEDKFTESVVCGLALARASEEKGARTVAKQAAEFTRYAARGKSAAVHIRGNHQRHLTAARSKYRLRDR